ncbi:MAG: putative toxin-antitoxin system toxin component, PIN family [Rhodobacteraceae bacterium]|nr:putative toxin-antitoxin system toxin component, PIN family [Paracoccaceae bacterium]
MRVFLDTNVLVSAFAARGLCADLLELALLEHDLVIGGNVLRELSKALREKVKLPASRTTDTMEFVTSEAAEVVNEVSPVEVEVDSDDALVLGEALAARAEFFVTGDAALLKFDAVSAMRIASPRRFWETLQGQKR